MANGNAGADIVHLCGTITLNQPLRALIDSDITFEGGGTAIIDGNASERLFFVRSGNVIFRNLTSRNALAKGGDGGGSGFYDSGNFGLGFDGFNDIPEGGGGGGGG